MSPSIFGSVGHLESGDSILESERRLWFWRRRSERVDVVRQLVTFCCAHESIWLAWEMISSLRQLCCASSDGSDAHAGGDASEMQLEVSCGRSCAEGDWEGNFNINLIWSHLMINIKILTTIIS